MNPITDKQYIAEHLVTDWGSLFMSPDEKAQRTQDILDGKITNNIKPGENDGSVDITRSIFTNPELKRKRMQAIQNGLIIEKSKPLEESPLYSLFTLFSGTKAAKSKKEQAVTNTIIAEQSKPLVQSPLYSLITTLLSSVKERKKIKEAIVNQYKFTNQIDEPEIKELIQSLSGSQSEQEQAIKKLKDKYVALSEKVGALEQTDPEKPSIIHITEVVQPEPKKDKTTVYVIGGIIILIILLMIK